jgi:hypothetical protein
MFNLNNDVLNRERRKLFPKIYTITHRLSLNSLKLLKSQKPFKFYRAFIKKYFPKKKRIQNESCYSSQIISLVSSSRNSYFSLPIKISSSCEYNSSKYSQDMELNQLEKKPFFSNKNKMVFDKKQILYIDFLKNKELKNLQNKLIQPKSYKVTNLRKIKKSNDELLEENKRSKSCVNNNISQNMANKYENSATKNKNTESSSNINLKTKRSQEQQTDETEFTYNKVDNNKIYKQKQQESKNNEIIFEKYYRENSNNSRKINKFYNHFRKNIDDKKDEMNLSGNKYIKIYWKNLRKPIYIKSSKFIDIKSS